MKMLLSMAVLSAAGLMMAGCEAGPTPAYTGPERAAMIGRNWTYEWQQVADDTDYLLLLRPEGELTYWDVLHRD